MSESQNKQPKPDGGQPQRPSPLMWIYLVVGGILVVNLIMNNAGSAKETSWNTFEQEMLAEDAVARMVVINDERAEVYIKESARGSGYFQDIDTEASGPHYYFTIGSVENLENKVATAEEEYELAPIDIRFENRRNWLGDILAWTLPFLILIAIWMYMLRRMGRRTGMGGGNPFDFGKSKAQMLDESKKPKVTFDNVAGMEEAKEEVREIVTFLKDPDQYTRLGARIPRGVMLIGPPGTGKTLMARAVAGEAGVPFFSISGSEFVEMFIGVGASRVRDLFKKAREKSPSIIFIDEIDAIGRARGGAMAMRSNDERESTLNQLLTEMDGFDNETNVIVMAATNRADILDRALLRPGRFDRHVTLELPNRNEREAIFAIHLKPIKLDESIDVETLAARTPGFSGADIANICNEAALIAAREKAPAVTMDHFYRATDRVIAGLEKKSKIITPEEKKTIAYHEAGHATASWYLPHADTLMKVSIIPRGRSLGAAWYLPEERQIYTKSQMLDRMVMALAGRAAEELIFNEISSGALDDLEKTTKQAYTMIAYYGLDDALGPVSYYDSSGQSEQSLYRPYSEETAHLIDQEVRKLVEQAYQQAIDLLRTHQDELEALAEELYRKEQVERKDLERIFESSATTV